MDLVCKSGNLVRPGLSFQVNSGLHSEHTSVVAMPASCSLSIPMICASVTRSFQLLFYSETLRRIPVPRQVIRCTQARAPPEFA